MAEKQKSIIGRITDKLKRDNERGARTGVIEELFYDFNRSRAQVYQMNFIRGIFFGVGTVIGGSLGIALLAWLLSLLANVFPPLHDFFSGVAHLLDSAKK